MLGDCNRFVLGTGWVELAHMPCKLSAILEIERCITFDSALPSPVSCVGVGEALLLRSRQRCLFDKEPLSFVPSSRATELNDHDSQRRIFAAPPSEGGIATREEHEVCEISAIHAERLISLQTKEITPIDFGCTLRTLRLTEIVEDDDLVWTRRRTWRVRRWLAHTDSS